MVYLGSDESKFQILKAILTGGIFIQSLHPILMGALGKIHLIVVLLIKKTIYYKVFGFSRVGHSSPENMLSNIYKILING